jgi:hypothetical protein
MILLRVGEQLGFPRSPTRSSLACRLPWTCKSASWYGQADRWTEIRVRGDVMTLHELPRGLFIMKWAMTNLRRPHPLAGFELLSLRPSIPAIDGHR